MTAFNIQTYQPGDAWETIEHFQRGFTAPRITEEFTASGQSTTPSFFEYRECPTGNPRTFVFDVQVTSGAGPFEVVLERSFDEGVSWTPMLRVTENISRDIDLTVLSMFRARAVSLAGGTTLMVRLIQNL